MLRARIVAACCGLISLASLFFERRTTGAAYELWHGLASIFFIGMLAGLFFSIYKARSARKTPP